MTSLVLEKKEHKMDNDSEKEKKEFKIDNDSLLMSLHSEDWKHVFPDYSYHKSEILNEKPFISILVSVYNKAHVLGRCLDSIVKQTIGMNDIELIIVDDASTDDSLNIAKEYLVHPNVQIYAFNENTGSPACPRNLAIIKSTGEYLMIHDGDDILHLSAMERLCEIVKVCNSDFIRGAVAVMEKGGEFRGFAGWHSSYTKKMNASIEQFPMLLNHLAPLGKIMKRELVIHHNLHFPHLKFSEDKKFYYDVLSVVKDISITDDVITYANREDGNKNSLVSTTDVEEKMNTNFMLLDYVLASNSPYGLKVPMLRRLVEFDVCSVYLANKKNSLNESNSIIHFERSLNFFQKIYDFGFDVRNLPIRDDLIKLLIEYILVKDFDHAQSLLKYRRAKTPGKRKIIQGQQYLIPSWEREFPNFQMDIVAKLKTIIRKADNYVFHVEITAAKENCNKVSGIVLINDKAEIIEQYRFTKHFFVENIMVIEIPAIFVDNLPNGYMVNVLYDTYKRRNIHSPADIILPERFKATGKRNLKLKRK